MQMARPGLSDAVIDARGGRASRSADEHGRIVHRSDDVQTEQSSFNLQQMDAVFHAKITQSYGL